MTMPAMTRLSERPRCRSWAPHIPRFAQVGPQAPPAPPLRCAQTALRYEAGPSYGLPGQSATGVNRGAGSRAAKKVRISTGVHKARRLVERFEWHYTPKHGSWLDLAESELGVLSSQCLDRRIPNKESLIEEIAAWELDRNANHSKANWQFSTQNARIKLKHLYPSI